MQQHKNKEQQQLWALTKDYKKDYAPDVAKGLSKLKSRIEQAPDTPVIGLKTWLMRAASIAILLMAGVAVYEYLAADTDINNQIVQTENSVIEAYPLPDGSTVWLNRQSSLSFPTTFSETERVIHLEGEAFLQVTKNPTKPFIVKTKEAHIKVLGTAFNIRAYEGEGSVSVAVEEGKVAIHSPVTNQNVVLEAGEKGFYATNEQQLSKTLANPTTDLNWKTKRLTFDETPITDILSYLTKNFEIKIMTTDDYSACALNATLVDNTPDAILERITTAFPLQLRSIDAQTYQLSGRCK